MSSQHPKSNPPTNLEVALQYAQRGWLVLPLHRIVEGRCGCGKPSCTNVGKHPDTRRGVHDATKDPEVIRAHWTRAPDAGVAIAPGASRSGVVILDIDVKDDGYASLAALEHDHGPLPPTLIAKTGGGGEHRYFLYSGPEIRTRIGFRKGLDLLADGGNFVVSPPSPHRSGNFYTWANWGCAPSPLPDLLVREAKPPARKRLHIKLGDHPLDERLHRCEAFLQHVRAAIQGDGGWKHTNGVCGIGGDFGLELDEFWPLLLRWNETCVPPWDEHGLRRKAEAIYERRDQPFGYRLDEEREREPIRFVSHEGPDAPPIGSEVAPPPFPDDEATTGSRRFRSSEQSPDPPPPDDGDAPPDFHVVDGEGGPKSGGGEGSLPVVVIGPDQRRVADEAIPPLVARDEVYERSATLSRIVVVKHDTKAKKEHGLDREIGSPIITTLPEAQIESLLSDCVLWKRYNKDQELVRAHPPKWATKDIYSRGDWVGAKRLVAVVESPVLRPDGTIFQDAGYDPGTGLYHHPNADYRPVPDRPSKKESVAAYKELIEIIVDFPMKHSCHASAWIAGLLTPFARYAFHGPTPMLAIDANVRGSGKSMLADLLSEIVTGRPMPRMSQTRDSEEERKRITSIALRGDRMVLIDNITTLLGSGNLDAALTSTHWEDRILGENRSVILPLLTCWVCTGNNIHLQGDTSRRCLHVRLESLMERPEERKDFRHPKLVDWVREHRVRLVQAALTVLRGYCVAGKPVQSEMVPWGSFEEWSDLVRGAIVWCGQPDPGDTRGALIQEADSDSATMETILRTLHEIAVSGYGTQATGNEGQKLAGVTVNRLINLFEERPGVIREPLEALKEALETVCSRMTPIVISRYLRKFKGRVFDARRLVSGTSHKTSVWCVERVD